MFLLYWLGLLPVFILLFVHLSRKEGDVDLKIMFLIVFISLLPVAREVAIISFVKHIYGWKLKNIVVFEKYGD